MNASEELKKDAAKAVEEFTTKGPFTSDKSPKEALASIAEFRAMLNALKEQEETIRKGLGMFKIDQPLSKDLQFMEKVSGLLPPHPTHPFYVHGTQSCDKSCWKQHRYVFQVLPQRDLPVMAQASDLIWDMWVFIYLVFYPEVIFVCFLMSS